MADATDTVGRKDYFSSLGFDQHYRNLSLIRADDIIMPSLGGAGSSLLGNIVLELGLHYVDLTKEKLLADGSSQAPTDSITRRIRARSFSGVDGQSKAPRFMKTHLPIEEFDDHDIGGVWLLVRDPRDALYSWYRYHRGFAELPWERVPDTFEEFLRQPFFTGVPPVEGWVSFYQGWSERAKRSRHFAVLRFEDLKSSPVETMRAAFTDLNLQWSPQDLERAVESSTFEAMRRHEDTVASGGSDARVMRSGAVGGWREWMTPELSSFFSTEGLATVAGRFGYDI
jgi:hypothetical protein